MRDDTRAAGPLLFMHVPKTAGTTLRSVVERQYRPASLFNLYPGHRAQLDALCDRAASRPPAAVMGHFRFGLHAAFPAGGRYVTFLRDPVDQVLSHFNHLTNSDAPPHRAVLRPGDGIDHFLGHEWARNLQTQYVTGLTAGEIEADPDGAFERAVDVIRRHFLFTGVVEAFDRSLWQLARRLGWRVPRYAPLNCSTERPLRVSRGDLPDAAVRSIRQANECDARLHRHARRLAAEEPRPAARAFARLYFT
jgi:hypothetical protein